MSSTIVDYRGRQADFWGFQPVLTPGKDELLVQSLVTRTNGGSIVAGIEKLVQKILVTLLTPLGSKLQLPTDGTEFLIDARQGLWRTVADVEQSFYSARVDMQRQIIADETAEDPADEKYGDVVLTSVVLAGDMVTIRVNVASAAGATRTVLTPIQVPLQ
jgi:hypothetical protein